MSAGALHYDYIRPPALPINRFLFDFRADAALRRRFLADPKGVLAEFDLPEAARAAILSRDVAGLVAAGAHPILAILLRVFADIDEHPEKFEFY